MKRPNITTDAVDAAVGKILAAADKTFCEYEAKPLLAAHGIQGTGERLATSRDHAAAIAEAMKINIEIVQDKERLRPADSEVERLYAGIEKAETLFGWQPKFRGLEGFKMRLSETANWFSDPANLSLYKMDRYNI